MSVTPPLTRISCLYGGGAIRLAAGPMTLLVGSSTARNRARLRCIADSFASPTCPTEALGLRLNREEVIVLLKWWLGLSVIPASDSLGCPSCRAALDSFGDHLCCCRKGGFYQRHSAIVGLLWHRCRAQGLLVALEVAVSDSLRPADLLTSHWKGSKPLAVDVTVVTR